MWVQYKPMMQLTLDVAKEIVSERLQHYQDIQAPVLIKNAKIKLIDKEAREFLFARNKGLKNVKAVAIVSSNIVNKMMATLIFRYHTPAVPHKMFMDERKAVLWLKQYV